MKFLKKILLIAISAFSLIPLESLSMRGGHGHGHGGGGRGGYGHGHGGGRRWHGGGWGGRHGGWGGWGYHRPLRWGYGYRRYWPWDWGYGYRRPYLRTVYVESPVTTYVTTRTIQSQIDWIIKNATDEELIIVNSRKESIVLAPGEKRDLYKAEGSLTIKAADDGEVFGEFSDLKDVNAITIKFDKEGIELELIR
jgi:hypothetical protein